MLRNLLLAVVLLFATAPLAAEENKGYFEFNKDRFLAGTTTVQDSTGVDDLFMIGETVRSEQAITGSAHLLGRKIISTGEIGGDAYLAGMDLSVDGKIAGDATLAGYNVQVDDVDGDLRMSGANLVVSGTVSGYALIAGDDVRIESVIKGDVSLTAREVEFADGARIEGSLTIYEEQAGKVQVPSGVISPGQVERRDISEWSESATELEVWDWPRALRRFLTGVMAITIIAAVIAALVPNKLAELQFSLYHFGVLLCNVSFVVTSKRKCFSNECDLVQCNRTTYFTINRPLRERSI